MPLYFFSEIPEYTIKNVKKLQQWLLMVIEMEKSRAGVINYVIVTDKKLLELNKTYLKRDYLTDVITFDYSDESGINADVFISRSRVLENAKIFKTSFLNEMHRVMVHGLLHILGFNDDTDNLRKEMRVKEDFYLEMAPKH